MTKKSMYVVIGDTGIYDDAIEWLVEVHPTQEGAKSRVDALNLIVSKWKSGKKKIGLEEVLRKNGDHMIPWADGVVEYKYVEVPYVEH